VVQPASGIDYRTCLFPCVTYVPLLLNLPW